MKALDLGAVEVLCKPGASYATRDIAQPLVHAIRSAAVAKISAAAPRTERPDERRLPENLLVQTTHKIIAIGASTGGTRAIEAVLTRMPRTSPGIVIVQHMPEHFTASFAQRLNELCALEVREARDNDHVVPGVALIAPGNRHMVLARSGGTYLVRIKDGPRVHYQRPSVDVLFQSVAQTAGRNAVGAILTGMGADGARGLLAMREGGAWTLAQDEASCVVFGMPKEAIKMNAADEVVALDGMAAAILQGLQIQPRPRRTAAGGET
jgi:two-component system chemotaxis response regulator CheB